MQPLENFMRKYYTDQAWLDKQRIADETPLEDRKKNLMAMRQVFAEIEADIDLDPASEAAQALTKRWLQLAEFAHGGNEAVRAGNIEAWNDRPNWPPEQQDRLLAAYGLDLDDRTAALQRFERVTKFIRRAIGRKMQTSLRALYGLEPLRPEGAEG